MFMDPTPSQERRDKARRVILQLLPGGPFSEWRVWWTADKKKLHARAHYAIPGKRDVSVKFKFYVDKPVTDFSVHFSDPMSDKEALRRGLHSQLAAGMLNALRRIPRDKPFLEAACSLP